MAKIVPLPTWHNEDAYIIGGGSSLKRFDFSQLEGKNTIGCNQAFKLECNRCQICLWCDFTFWETYHKELASYGGWVATNYKLYADGDVCKPPVWLNYFQRQDEGLAKAPHLAFNNNTGATAINLALILGASRVFLLGVDLAKNNVTGKTHWHNDNKEKQDEDSYIKFQRGYKEVASALPVVYPGREVWNVTDGTSRLSAFPTCTYQQAGFTDPSEVSFRREECGV